MIVFVEAVLWTNGTYVPGFVSVTQIDCPYRRVTTFTLLNSNTSAVFLIAAARAFHYRGPATEKVLSELFCSDARYAELARVRRSEPTADRISTGALRRAP